MGEDAPFVNFLLNCAWNMLERSFLIWRVIWELLIRVGKKFNFYDPFYFFYDPIHLISILLKI